MGEPLGRIPRQVVIADHLWEAFDHMSRDMGGDRDGLINQALFAFAKQQGYLAPIRGPSEPVSMPHEGYAPAPISYARPAPAPAPVPIAAVPNPFVSVPGAVPRAAAIPVPPIPAIPPPSSPIMPSPSPVVAAPAFQSPLPPAAAPIPIPSIPPVGAAAASPAFDPLSEIKLDLPSRPASQPPAVSLPAGGPDSQPVEEFGATLGSESPASKSAASAADGGPTLVLYAEGRELDRVTGQRFLIGRGKHCDLIINSGKVSREHAVIIREGADFYIEDLGSSNGTWFDKKRITRRQIGDGDEYFVCSEKITCHLSAA